MSNNFILKPQDETMYGLEKNKNELLNVVVKSNELIIKGKFSLSAQQQKIMMYIISQIEKEDTHFKEYEFNIKDFCTLLNIDKDNGRIYTLLKQQIKDIADKSMWFKDEKGKDVLVRWIEKPYIDTNSGLIRIRLDSDMKPYLLQLKNNFTRYNLIYPLSFNSKYSIRLYEILKSVLHENNDYFEKIFFVEELKSLLDCEHYTLFKDFNVRVLQTAKREINANSDINIDYTFIKTSRKVQYVKVYIFDKDIHQTEEIKYRLLKENKED